MSELPKGFHVDGLYCFPVGAADAGSFRYLPAGPIIEQGEDGARASLLSSDAGGVLSLQMVWQADDATIDKAKAEIRERYPDAEPVDLRIADVSDLTATLTVTDAAGETHEVGTQQTSGSPAYRVVFQHTLRKTEKEAVARAFEGTPDLLSVTYTGELQLMETAAVKISGDLASQLKALAPKIIKKKGKGIFGKTTEEPGPLPTMAECAAGVETAISDEDITLKAENTANVPPETVEANEEAAKKYVTKQLFDQIEEMGTDAVYMNSFQVKKTMSEPVPLTFSLRFPYDLAGPLTDAGGASLIQTSSATIPEPER
jgi:hypothetical protein